MEVVGIVLAAVLAAAVVVLVARPFLAEPGTSEGRIGEPDAAESERLRLLEERDRTLGGLRELEFDHRTGKISDADYREQIGPLRQEAAEVLRALEPKGRPSASPAES